MDNKSIRQAIINKVGSTGFSAWTIGLTHDPQKRKQEHGNEGKNTNSWQHWTADSLSDAQEIENYFINEKGMKGGIGGDLNANRTVYVYIF